MIRPWDKVGCRDIGDFRIFKMREDRARSPRTGEEHDFFVIDCVDWVNVLAITPDQQVVLVEQFRHGSGTVELEVPGGMIDPHDVSPEIAGARELREETGYVGESPLIIGTVYANPAIQTNRCHTILVRNCRNLHAATLDHAEDLLTRLVPVADLPRLVAEGHIRHSLVVVALYHFELWRQGVRK
jgi:8-oxo-dGTP pyrophosphatase MutT (NUDIX family)